MDLLRNAQSLYASGQYFKAARYAFQAREVDPLIAPDAYAWITLGLVRAHLYQSASYFFIRTLQSGSPSAIRRVLAVTEELLLNVGADLLRKYLIRHTRYEDYDSLNRSAYLYALGRSALLDGRQAEVEKAVGYLNGMSEKSPLWPFALQVRGAAHAILGKTGEAIRDFRECSAKARSYVGSDETLRQQTEGEAEDLEARCLAGEARTLYETERFEEADQAYDRISKSTMVWPDVLFEQGWNSFARKEYNRTLGKLVSYKSPALSFVFNPEIEVLRAQTFLALCLYDEAGQVIADFNSRYERMSAEVKQFIESQSSNLPAFYDLGVSALRAPLNSADEKLRMLNHFVRGPYFKRMVTAESSALAEIAVVANFNLEQAGVSQDPGRGFPGFLKQVLQWRAGSIRMLGGAFVKNSLLDHHAELIANFDRMSFIKLEILKRAKDRLLMPNRKEQADRSRGNVVPGRRSYQYYWGFNGEFWNDELGDYVFGLESECKGGEGV
jgi:tetratricopeptide (TPR) repeat protein